MTDTDLRRSSKLLSVRLGADDRNILDELADASDRTRTQLVRYALTAYLDATTTGTATGTATEPPTEPETTRHTALRLPADLADRVAAVAEARNWTPSEILRAAVTWWIAAGNVAALGAPQGSAK